MQNGLSMTFVDAVANVELSGEPDPAAVAAQSRVGELLNGKWRLDAVLGVGGSAAVYAATQRSGGRAAIKLLHADYTFHEQLRLRLGGEAQILRRMNQPTAVRLLEEGVCTGGELFLAMELLQGVTLSQYLARNNARLEPDHAVQIGLLLLDAVVAMHAFGVLHRDLTLGNVVITPSGEIKLIDFGISRPLSQPEWGLFGEIDGVLGTPGFMPPEQARGLNQQVDVQSDLWAVGAILFELLSGLPVHVEAHTLSEKLSLAASTPAPKLGSVAEHVRPELQALIDCALAFEKCQRFDNAQQMREALRKIYIWGSRRPPQHERERCAVAPGLPELAASACELTP